MDSLTYWKKTAQVRLRDLAKEALRQADCLDREVDTTTVHEMAGDATFALQSYAHHYGKAARTPEPGEGTD